MAAPGGGGGGAASYNPQMTNIPSGYQPQSQAPNPAQPAMEGTGQMPPSSAAGGNYAGPPAVSMGYADQGLPSMGHPSMAYTSMPPTMDYSAFNMQSKDSLCLPMCCFWSFSNPAISRYSVYYSCLWSVIDRFVSLFVLSITFADFDTLHCLSVSVTC